MFYCMADLSHWDSLADPLATDFAKARAYGITKIALKATQGDGYVDSTFAPRRAAALAAGTGVCAYAFLDATLPASAQAKWFLKTVGALDGIELAIDVETNAGGAGGTVSIPLASDVAQAIADSVGFLPIFYSTRWGPDGKGGGLPNAVLSQCPLWLAEWGNLPVCPVGWEEWRLWQNTDGQTGSNPISIPGLGMVDRSYVATDSLAAIDAWWGKR
jgi:lysozyme